MKTRKQIVFLIASFFLILSCKEGKKVEHKTLNSQMKEVMAIHDEVMPKMSLLGKMVGEMTVKEDSSALGLQYKNARIDLQAAHKSMMDWMQGFGNRFDSDEILNGKELSGQKQIWLDEEEENVKALRDQINSSIEEAKKLLDKS
jgi:hypothetical protein